MVQLRRLNALVRGGRYGSMKYPGNAVCSTSPHSVLPRGDGGNKREGMGKKNNGSAASRISDDAICSQTGHTWAEWFELLDAAEGTSMNHKELVAYIGRNHPGVSEWWRQMLTVGYEQARGLREKHFKPDGFEVSRSKTIGVSVSRLYKAWEDYEMRQQWLPEHDLHIRQATRDRSMRITWSDGASSVDANFYPKGDEKCQIVVQHRKLPNSEQAEAVKGFWSNRLINLKKLLEAS